MNGKPRDGHSADSWSSFCQWRVRGRVLNGSPPWCLPVMHKPWYFGYVKTTVVVVVVVVAVSQVKC